MGCHGNHELSYNQRALFFGNHAFSKLIPKVFEDNFVSHSGGPNEQFSTYEKLSWGMQGNLNWMLGYYHG